jgi:hypothetical protein
MEITKYCVTLSAAKSLLPKLEIASPLIGTRNDMLLQEIE